MAKHTTARVLHNIALATAFGGPLFGKIALGPAVEKVTSETERGLVLQTAWSKYNGIDAIAHATFGLTWLVNRRPILKAKYGNRAHKLVHLKDALITGAVLTGLANVLAGAAMARDFPQGVPVISGNEPSPNTPEKAVRYQRFFKVMGRLNIALVAASIVIGPVIAHAAMKGAKRSLLKHVFR